MTIALPQKVISRKRDVGYHFLAFLIGFIFFLIAAGAGQGMVGFILWCGIQLFYHYGIRRHRYWIRYKQGVYSPSVGKWVRE